MKKVFNVLLLGLGNIAMGYDMDRDDVCWTHLKAISKHSGFTLISAIDPDPNQRDKFEAHAKISAFSTLQEFLAVAHPEIDLVVIATPTRHHLDDYRQIKKIKPSLVLMEKPLVNSIDQFSELKTELANGPSIIVNLFRLYQRSLNEKLSELNRSGYCRVHIRYSGSLVHNGIHFISLLETHFGECLSYEKIMVNDEACFLMRYKNANAFFQKAYPDLDDNSMTVQSSLGTYYYLNGGRISFFIDKNNVQTHYDQYEFNQHMLYVYDKCMDFFEKKHDKSLSLAISGQNTLLKCEQSHA